jgi:hypothetical protein
MAKFEGQTIEDFICALQQTQLKTFLGTVDSSTNITPMKNVIQVPVILNKVSLRFLFLFFDLFFSLSFFSLSLSLSLSLSQKHTIFLFVLRVTFGISHRQLQKSLLGLDGIF